jgi:hypothetical protein
MAVTIDTENDNEVLTVEEAASILRIGRTAAYAAARQWRASGGTEGLPCIEIGRTLRVPRAALRHLLDEAPPPGGRADADHAA